MSIGDEIKEERERWEKRFIEDGEKIKEFKIQIQLQKIAIEELHVECTRLEKKCLLLGG